MSDGDTKNKTIKTQTKQISICERCIIDVGNVFSAFWVRCALQTYNGYKRLVLDSRRGLLLNFRMFLVILYIAYSLSK
jgi:hypothetical protein